VFIGVVDFHLVLCVVCIYNVKRLVGALSCWLRKTC
jgi:hypothetical protein